MDDVTSGDRVRLQSGSLVTGVVTRVGPVEVEGEDHQVLAVEPRALEVGGQSYALDAEVVDAERKADRDLVNRENIAIVGGVTLAGAVLGELILDDALLGAVVGAAGGTAIAIARSDTEIELEQGSILTLRLDSAIRPVSRHQASANR